MSRLPRFPRLPVEVIAESDAAHADVAARFDALDPDAGVVARAVLWQRLVEALAGVGAIEFDREEPRLLLPPRRRFLSTESAARLEGVAMALRHVDTRLAMFDRGLVDHVIAPESPMILNAFSESRDPSQRETNAGSLRAGPSAFVDAANVYTPPAAEHCRSLVTELVTTIRDAPLVHALELGAWTTLATFAIHPFVDGNGRTARLLFQAIHSSAVPGRFDWGSIEGWAAHRQRYITAIHRSLPVGALDDVDHIEPDVFAGFAAVKSIEGARRTLARLELIEESMHRWRSTFGDATQTFAFVAFERNVSSGDFAVLGDVAQHVTVAEDLCVAGHLQRDVMGRYVPARVDR